MAEKLTMAEPSLTQDQELQVESHAPYLKVFAWLTFLTAIEYFWAHWFKDALFGLVVGLLFYAIVKASMVGWYFMHLKFEGKWVYGWLIPGAIFAVILTTALIPDVAMQPETDENFSEDVTVQRLAPQPAPTVLLSDTR